MQRRRCGMSIKPRSTDRPLDILLLTPDKPYPSESGAALRNWGIIKGLSDGDHRLTLLSFSDSPLDPNANPLFRHCREVITCSAPHRDRFSRIFTLLTSGRADIETRLLSDGFQRALERTLSSKSFDIIQFSGIEMACYLPAIQARQGKAKVIYDALNAEADLQRIIAAVDRGQPRRILQALYSTLQARRLQRFESELCQAVDAVVAVSDEDKSLLSRHAGAPIFVLPNGIFADEYVADCPSKRDADTLVFSGKMGLSPECRRRPLVHARDYAAAAGGAPGVKAAFGRTQSKRAAAFAGGGSGHRSHRLGRINFAIFDAGGALRLAYAHGQRHATQGAGSHGIGLRRLYRPASAPRACVANCVARSQSPTTAKVSPIRCCGCWMTSVPVSSWGARTSPGAFALRLVAAQAAAARRLSGDPE